MTSYPPMHFSDWFRRHAVTRPNQVAIVTPKARLTYAELFRALHAAAYRLSECGIEPGQTIGLYVLNPALHCVLIAALNRMGCPVVSFSRQVAPGEAIAAPPGVTVDRILVEQPFAGAAPADAIAVDLDWLKSEDGRRWQGEGFRDPHEPILIFMSSGTTGTEKAVALSTVRMERRILRCGIGAFGEHNAGRTLTHFGARTAVGFRLIFESLWAGGTVFAGFPEAAALKVIAKNGIQTVQGSAAHFQATMRQSDPAEFDLSSLRHVFVAGSIAPKPLVNAIRAKLCRTLLVLYGATEIGSVAFGPLRPQNPSSYVGLLTPWMEGEVVDDEGNVLPAGEEGELRFRSDAMATGYVGDAEATARSFRDGWFYPGDRGVITDKLALAIMGRVSERINAGGVKVSPDAIEETVMAHEGVAECAAFGVPDAMGVERICVAVVARGDFDIDSLKRRCAARLGTRAPLRYLNVKSLPRNEAGKVLRTALRLMVEGESRT